jgi:hypothetical protein
MGLRSQRPRRRWLIVAPIVALLAGGTATALALHSSAAAAASPLRYPRTVVRSIDAAALGQKSVRWTEKGGESNSMEGLGPTGKTGTTVPHWRSTSDVTANSGVKRITITHFRGGVGTAEIRLVGNLVYVKGNVRALEWMALDVTHAQALRYAERWISIPKWQDRRSTYLSEELTLADLVDNEANPARYYGAFAHLPDYVYLAATRESDGTRFVTWDDEGSEDPSVSSTLSARTGGEPLPIAATNDDNGEEAGQYYSDWSSGRFSRWNEPMHVTAPKHAVPIATVRGR